MKHHELPVTLGAKDTYREAGIDNFRAMRLGIIGQTRYAALSMLVNNDAFPLDGGWPFDTSLPITASGHYMLVATDDTFSVIHRSIVIGGRVQTVRKEHWFTRGIALLFRHPRQETMTTTLLWEIGISYRLLPDETHDAAVQRAMAQAMKNTQSHSLIYTPFFWLLSTRSSVDALTRGLGLYLVLRQHLDIFFLSILELEESFYAADEAPKKKTASSRLIIEALYALVPKAMIQDLQVHYGCYPIFVHLATELWQSPHVAGILASMLLLVDEIGQSEVADALLGLGAVAVLLHPDTEQMDIDVHVPCEGDLTRMERASFACRWYWIQSSTLRGIFLPDGKRFTLPTALHPWFLPEELYAPIWCAVPSVADESRWMQPGTRGQFEAIAASLIKRADAGVRPVVGCYDIRIPEGFPALAAVGVERIALWMQDNGYGWLRMGPADTYPIILPFAATAGPMNVWRLVLTERIAWEVLLILLAWLSDMRHAGTTAVMHAPTVVPLPEPSKSRKKAKGKVPLYLPRRASNSMSMSITVGDYATPEERATIARRAADIHGVRAHLWHRPGVTMHLRAIQARAWEQLDLVTRMQILFGPHAPRMLPTSLDYPAEGQIRGMRVSEAEDGTLTITLGYQRGRQITDEHAPAPRPVVCQGLQAVITALKLLPEQEEAIMRQEMAA